MSDTITCKKHGIQFKALDGCPECLKEIGKSGFLPIVKVKLQTKKIDNQTQRTSVVYDGRPYTYYSEDELEIGDIVEVPILNHKTMAQVVEIDIPESEIESFRDKMKTITHQSKELGETFIDGDIGIEAEVKFESDEQSMIQAGLVSEVKNVEYIENGEGQLSVNLDMEARLGTAIINIAPGQDASVVKLLNEVMRIRQWADTLVVSNKEEAERATADLSLMANLKKAVEEKRKEYTVPLNDHLKSINDSFKLLSGPLAEADRIARGKVLVYQKEQERKRREAEEINRQKAELARKEAELHHGEFTVDTTPIEVPPEAKVTRTDLGTSGMVDNWKWKVIDESLIPREYLIPDEAMLNAIAKKHHDKKQVPGIEFYCEKNLRVRAK